MKNLPCPLTLIAACGLRGELGLNNNLPWHQATDLKFFSDKTKKSVLIMGRLTFESLGKKLPVRRHCILSKSMNMPEEDDLKIVRSITQLWEWLKKENINSAFVIGGSQIYSLLAPFCSKLLITHIHGSVPADTFLDLSILHKCRLVTAQHVKADADNQFSMTFATYEQDLAD